MGGKRWSQAEDAVLAAIVKEGLSLISQMHRLPGRSHAAAKNYASKMDMLLSGATAWTPEEQSILRKIYRGKESIKLGVSRLLPNRSYLAAKGEAQRLGLSGTKKRVGRTGYSWVERAIETVLDATSEQLSTKQLAEKTGASINAISKILAKQRGKKFRVGAWTRTGNVGDWTGMWELGKGPDAPRPPRRSNTQNCRNYRRKQQIRAGHVNPFATIVQQVAA